MNEYWEWVILRADWLGVPVWELWIVCLAFAGVLSHRQRCVKGFALYLRLLVGHLGETDVHGFLFQAICIFDQYGVEFQRLWAEV